MTGESHGAALAGRDWSAYDLLPDPVLVLDGEGRLVHATPAARELLGEGAVPGAPVPGAFAALRHPALEQGLRQALSGAGPRTLRACWAAPGDAPAGDATLSPAHGGVVLVLRPPAAEGARADAATRISDGLVRAGMALSSASSLERVLEVLADVSREVASAKYAAMGVLNAEGTALSAFVTSGLTPEQRERMGRLPTGHGILGLLIRDPRPIRLRDLRDHPASAGTPRHHPEMHSFLGVPVMAGGRVFGNLYVTQKLGGGEFSDDDMALVETVAAQAAVAIENASLRRERDRFFAAASHELGNAVTGVQVWARHLLRRPPETPEALVEGLRHVQSGAEHASRLIDDLLSLSRIEEGRLTLDVWRVDVGEIAREAVAQLAPGAEAASVRVEHHAHPALPSVEADPVRVRQIVVNLLANAIKFTPEGGTILVEAVPHEEGGACVTVADPGPGIAPEDRERIFEPYQQVQGVARGRGTGLGLPLSRRLARLMGGDLWVESEVGQGSRFTLRLPARMPAGNG